LTPFGNIVIVLVIVIAVCFGFGFAASILLFFSVRVCDGSARRCLLFRLVVACCVLVMVFGGNLALARTPSRNMLRSYQAPKESFVNVWSRSLPRKVKKKVSE